jgi:hypothetical protein
MQVEGKQSAETLARTSRRNPDFESIQQIAKNQT